MQTSAVHILKHFLLSEPRDGAEALLQGRWRALPPDMAFPLGASGMSLKVLSCGEWNLEAGPDFIGAKIEISGRTLRGDVEVHRKASDWFRHGHQGDPAYANVILHVVETDDLPAPSPLRFPCFELPPDAVAGPGGAQRSITTPGKGRCASHFSALSPGRLGRMMREAGVERLRLKSKALLEDMIKAGVGAAFLKRLFDAAGFKRNRNTFAVLLQRYLEHPEDMRLRHCEAILWGESGLLPDPAAEILDDDSRDCARRIWDAWWTLRPKARPPIQWQRSGSRPLNSPERRIASLCSLISRLGENPLPSFASKLKGEGGAGGFAAFAMDSLSTDDPFWNLRTSFDSAPLKRPASSTGRSRALELVVDVLMPSLLAFASLNSDKNLSAEVEKAYLALPSTAPNRAFTNAMNRWFINPEDAAKALRDAASRQGVLHIHSSYCLKVGADCSACLLFNSI